MPHPSGANQDDAASRDESPLPGGPRVREACLADADRLGEINALAWRDAYAGIVPAGNLDSMELGTLRDRWVARIQDPRDRVNLVAEVDGRLASYAIVGDYRTQHDAEPEDTIGWGELYAIYTDPDLQGRGAGSAVHDAAIAAVASRGYAVAALWVLRDNAPTRRWYGARGWQPDGASSEWLGSGVPLEEIRLVRSTNGSFCNPSSRLGR